MEDMENIYLKEQKRAMDQFPGKENIGLQKVWEKLQEDINI